MSVGLLLITHQDLGRAVLRQADKLVGGFSIPVRVLEVQPDDDPTGRILEASGELARLDAGDGVLVLTDLYGATPSNIAHALGGESVYVVVHGLNLAMLMRAHNYGDLSLDELVQKVLEGGRRAIFAGDPD